MRDALRLKKIERAQLHVLFTCPFFAPGVMKLENRIITDAEAMGYFGPDMRRWTACTDGRFINWTPAFLDSLSQEETATVLVHEVWHCLAGHLWRVPADVDWDLWNVAADHETNLMIKEFSVRVKAGKNSFVEPFPFPKPPERFYANPAYAGMAVEAIYADLVSKGDKNPNPGGKTPYKASQSGNQGTVIEGSMPNFGQMVRPNGKDTKELSNSWTNTLIQSAKLAQAGTLPGELSKMVEGIVNPKLDWTQILRSLLREQINDDWDFDVPAVEYEPSGFLLPSLESEGTGTVVFGSDWSGSTYGELVEKFHAEKQNCLDQMNPKKLVDIGFDTRVIWEKEYTPGDQIDRRVSGGGGTSFVDVLDRCGKLQPEPKAVVILTDLEGEFPKRAPSFPVIWVVYNNPNASAPFGETIHAN